MLLAGMLSALGQAQATQDAAPAPGAPRARGWDDFPAFVWREKYAGKPLPEELAEPFGGVILMREEDSAWARERGLAYLVWNVAGRDALHLDADEAWNARVERWIETRDEQLLVREPCLNATETVARMLATMDTTIAKHGGHPGLGFVLGDEVGLTPSGDPFDLCRCTLCERLWQGYADEHDLPERAPLTDEVRLGLVEGDHSLLGAWLARRRFHRERMTHVLGGMSNCIRTRVPSDGPRFPVGLLGLRGTTPFDGIDLGCSVWIDFDFVELYPVNDARQLQLGLPGLQVRGDGSELIGSLATIFLADETPDSAAWRIWEHWLRGGNAVVLWSDAALTEQHRERMAAALHTIRAIGQLFPDLQPPSNTPVALVQDADSIALAWLKDALLDGPTWPRRRASFQERNGTRETSVRRWLAELEDQGVLPASIPLECLDDPRRDFDVLILPEVCVLGPADLERLGRHAREQGLLIVDGTFGWVDRAGQPREEDPFERLRACAPERVVRADPRDHALEESVLSRLRAGNPRFLGDTAALPWLVARRPLRPERSLEGEPAYLLALLPRLDRAEHRERFPEGLTLTLEPPAGTEWEELHPAVGEKLAPGDAALYLVRPLPPDPEEAPERIR